MQTNQTTKCNQEKSYPIPHPAVTPRSLIPKRRQPREDPYKVAIRESQKISMERGLEETSLSLQIKMLEDQSNPIPSNVEPGFQMNSPTF